MRPQRGPFPQRNCEHERISAANRPQITQFATAPNVLEPDVAAVPNWSVGETFLTGRGHEWRIVAIDTDIADELVEQGFNAVWTVEPA